MKKSLFLAMLAALALAACQDEKAPAASTVSMPAAAVSESVQPMSTAEAQQPARPVKSAVAVTKPDTGGSAKSIQAAMHHIQMENPAAQQAAVSQLGAVKDAAKDAIKNSAKPALSAQRQVKPAIKKVARAAVSKPVAAVLPVIPAKPIAVAGDAAIGKSIARKCKACHNFTAKKKVGPGLKGIFGRKVGIMPGMRYSKALSAGGWVWDEKHLHAWDCDSRKAIKVFSGNPSAKTKMPPQHICSEAKLANLIAFLKTL